MYALTYAHNQAPNWNESGSLLKWPLSSKFGRNTFQHWNQMEWILVQRVHLFQWHWNIETKWKRKFTNWICTWLDYHRQILHNCRGWCRHFVAVVGIRIPETIDACIAGGVNGGRTTGTVCINHIVNIDRAETKRDGNKVEEKWDGEQ